VRFLPHQGSPPAPAPRSPLPARMSGMTRPRLPGLRSRRSGSLGGYRPTHGNVRGLLDPGGQPFRRCLDEDSSHERSSASYLLVPRLIYWCHDRSPARLGRGDRRVALSSAAHRESWCGSHLACAGRSPWRGEAQEGSAQLEEALPSSLTAVRSMRGGRCGLGDHRDGSAQAVGDD
jgi:hypothetical protein